MITTGTIFFVFEFVNTVPSSISHPVVSIKDCRKKKLQTHWVAWTSFPAPMKRLMPPRFNKEAFPNGSPVAVHTNGKSPSSWFAFPKCTSCSRPRRWFLFRRDPALMCMHLCHIIQRVLQLTPTWHLNSPTNWVVMPWWHDCCSGRILYASLIQARPPTRRLLG